MPPAKHDALIKWANEILDQPVTQYSDQEIATALAIPLEQLPAARRAMRDRMLEQLNQLAHACEPKAQAGNKKPPSSCNKSKSINKSCPPRRYPLLTNDPLRNAGPALAAQASHPANHPSPVSKLCR